MATKQTEPLKIQYKELVELNKRLRNICDVFYIAYDGNIFMHSLVPFIEKFAIILPDQIPLYRGIMYLPNEFFNFSKLAKISKLSITETQKTINCGQIDSEDLCIKLNKIYVPSEEISESSIITENIYPKMYSRLHHFVPDINNYDYVDIDDEFVNHICDNKVVGISDPSGLYMALSKNIFPSIKSDDKLSYTILPLRDEKNDKKTYVLFRKETKEMIIFTVCAYLNIRDIYEPAN